MKAAAIDRFGPPSVIRLHTLPVPRPGPRQVLIAMHTAGVGIWDTSVRDGSFREGPVRFPLVLGTDGSGVVVARGRRVRRLRIGDRVYSYLFSNRKGGFSAEYVAVDAQAAARIPRALDSLEAGAAAVTGLTAVQGIDALRLRRGETVLIFGATGAVGTLAIQFAKLRRVRVVATASGKAAARLVRRLGADAVIDARSPDMVERLQRLAPGGIDAALACAGGEALERCLDLMRAGGRLVYPNGIEPEPRRRLAIRQQGFDAAAGPRQFARLGRAVTKARLRVPIAARYPLAQAAKAHARLERGHVLGRIVLQIKRR